MALGQAIFPKAKHPSRTPFYIRRVGVVFMSFHKVFVALDQSNQAATVFAEALKIAADNQATLMLFCCIQEDTSAYSMSLSEQFGISPHLFDQAYQMRNAQIESQVKLTLNLLKSYEEKATEAGVNVEFDYKLGDPGSWICRMADHWQADVIVMGRRGRRGLTEIVLGSVSNYVLHHAPCSVFVVQPRIEAQSAAQPDAANQSANAEINAKNKATSASK